MNRWLERAAAYCKQFNDSTTTELEIPELQADEIRTFAGDKDNVVWIFASLDVSSRLWPSTVIGRRIYHNTYKLFKDALRRIRDHSVPLIVTDGFEYYAKVSGSTLLPALSAGYSQVEVSHPSAASAFVPGPHTGNGANGASVPLKQKLRP